MPFEVHSRMLAWRKFLDHRHGSRTVNQMPDNLCSTALRALRGGARGRGHQHLHESAL